MTNNKNLFLPLEKYNFNGIVHVGAETGEYANYYHKLGIYKVMWIEKNKNLHSSLYQHTSRFGMKQLYYMVNLSNVSTNESLTFKDLWRKNAAYIDIESYDLLHIATNKNIKEIIEGFENFKEVFRAIVLSKNYSNEDESYLNSLGYSESDFVESQHLFIK